MTTEPTWPEVGKQCCCIRDTPWVKVVILDLGIMKLRALELIPGPDFMSILTISNITFDHEFEEGHRMKLSFTDWPDDAFCACNFQPLEELSHEEEHYDYEHT